MCEICSNKLDPSSGNGMDNTVTEQTRGWGWWTIYCYRMNPPMCSGGPPPCTRFTLPAARKRHLSMPEIGEKERDYLFKELYKLKSNDLMSSLRSQSPLEYPQTHSPSVPPLPSPGYCISEKEIEVYGFSLPKTHDPKKTLHGCHSLL